MSKEIRFRYEDYSSLDEPWSEVPTNTTLNFEYTFEDDTRWPTIMQQFIKFLEAIGYAGVQDKIILVDPHGMEGQVGFFKTVTEDPTEEQTYHINTKDNE